ncbi:hypothetical protein CWI77_04785 [Pseudidiomarina planktonica]|nr:hypothetical protein CWI77_04785 [Pseudidiomarina planktonica]
MIATLFFRCVAVVKFSFYLFLVSSTGIYSSQLLAAELSVKATQSEVSWISISAPSRDTIWLAGSQGTIGRSTDGGETWSFSKPGSNELEFRDIEALDDQRAFALSVGEGGNSRVYYTSNAGRSWQLRYRADSNLFMNCLAVAPSGEALAFADSYNERWQLIRSADGRNWLNISNVVDSGPLSGEGGFSASGNCIQYKNDVWAIGTGNAVTARVLIKPKFGIRFKVMNTPMLAGPMRGITAIWPRAENDFFIAGGDLSEAQSQPQVMHFNAGEFTTLPTPPLQGAIYSLSLNGEQLLVSNPSGAAIGSLTGENWQKLTSENVWATQCTEHQRCYLAGKNGYFASFELP